MTNEEIARLLEIVAELYDISGENPFKARAYLRAAQSIRLLPSDIETVFKSQGLESIPGVGKSISKQIEEYLKSGRMPILEELSAKIPVEIIELTKIPHVGPKTAKILFQNYGILTVEDLKEALFTGKLKEVRGISSKTLKKIKDVVLKKKVVFHRMLLSEAEELASRVVSFFKRRHPEILIVPAGSLRRGKETVGDLDFVVSGGSVRQALKEFTNETRGSSTEIEGEEVFRITGPSNVSYDFLVSEKENLGSALVHLTGSKEHNIELRRLAKKLGGKLTHEGFFYPDGKAVRFSTEEDLYRFFGLQFIPPELREGGDEIELARKGLIPALIENSDLKGDLHVHSDWSDGSASLEELADVAAHLGFEYLAVCDHAKRLMVARGLSTEEIEVRNSAIDEINKRFNGRFRLLKGIELNIDKDGKVDYEIELLSSFDFCIASLHWNLSQAGEEITERLLKAMKNPYVDGIGHPTTRLLMRRPEADIDFKKVFELAAETGTFFEINAFPDRLDLPPNLVRLAKSYGVKFFIGTDSHSLSHLNLVKYGIITARRGLLTKKDVINTLPVDDLIYEVKKRRAERMKRYG